MSDWDGEFFPIRDFIFVYWISFASKYKRFFWKLIWGSAEKKLERGTEKKRSTGTEMGTHMPQYPQYPTKQALRALSGASRRLWGRLRGDYRAVLLPIVLGPDWEKNLSCSPWLRMLPISFSRQPRIKLDTFKLSSSFILISSCLYWTLFFGKVMLSCSDLILLFWCERFFALVPDYL